MHTNLIKLCVGADDIDDLADWQRRQMIMRAKAGLPERPSCQTRMSPKRAEELTDGGSLYWVIKGMILVRSPIVDVQTLTDRGGRAYCEIDLDPALVRVVPTPRKAFQGWRYLEPKDAPADLGEAAGGDRLPEELAVKLRESGVW